MLRRPLKSLLLLVLAAGLMTPALNRTAAAASAGPVFADVPQSHPDRAFIEYLANRQMINGYPDGRFGPTDSLTRAAAVKIAAQVAGLMIAPDGPATGFTDLPDGHWSVPYVRASVAGKLVLGFEDRTFRPDEPLTRAQLAALALRATGRPTDRLPGTALTDVEADDWFHAAARLAVASGMMTAPEGSFRPDATATRAEAARAFAQALTFTPLAADRPLKAAVTVEQGQVELAPAGGAGFATVAAGTSAGDGARIRTGPASAANLNFPDGSALLLDEQSELELVRVTGTDLVSGTVLERLEARLMRGRLFGALVPRPELTDKDPDAWWQAHAQKRERMTILLPWAELAVYGSVISAQADAEGNSASVLGGSAELRSAAGQTQPLGDGQRSEVTAPDEPPAAPAPLTQADQQQWGAQSGWVTQRIQAIAELAPAPFQSAAGAEGARIAHLAAGFPRDTVAPTVSISSPASGSSLGAAAVTLSGTAADDVKLAAVTVGGTAARIGADGAWTAAVTLQPGENRVTAVALDGAGNRAEAELSLRFDPALPAISLEAPAVTAQGTTIVTGRATAPGGLAGLTVAATSVVPAADGSFQLEVALSPGDNRIPATVVDAQQRSASVTVGVLRDDRPPEITVADLPSVTGLAQVTVRGTVRSEGAPLAAFSVNGHPVLVADDGQFRALVRLRPGPNEIRLTAADIAGNQASSTSSVTRDSAALSLHIARPGNGLITREAKLQVQGTATGTTSVTVNGMSTPVDLSGTFATAVTLNEGANTVTLALPGLTPQTRTVYLVTQAPSLAFTAFRQGQQVVVSGTATAAFGALASLSVNGLPAVVGAGGSFRVTLTLAGANSSVTVAAMDAAGNKATATEPVTAAPTAPPLITLHDPTQGATVTVPDIAVAGVVTVDAGLTLASLTVNGAKTAAGADGSFSATVTAETPGEQSISVVATDSAGQSASALVTVTYQPPAAGAGPAPAPAPTPAPNAGSIVVVAPATVRVGESFTVAVRFENVTNVVTAGVKLLFDPVLAHGGPPESGGTVEGFAAGQSTDNVNGQSIYIRGTPAGTSYSGSGTYFLVTFTARAKGVLQLNLQNVDPKGSIQTLPGGYQQPPLVPASVTVTD